jgi:DNA-3-methyladenine glycosylase
MSRAQRAATLPVRFFARRAEIVAAELIGAVMVSRVGGSLTAGRIVETEAYLGVTDPASHAFDGRRTAHNASIYGGPGLWYVYRSYGIHWCANLVAAGEGEAAAVLIRALEPLEGLEVMRARRGPVPERHLCSGPGKLCQALGITRALDGEMMPRSEVAVVAGARPARVAPSRRIGITRAAEWPLRFVEAGSRWLSRPWRE